MITAVSKTDCHEFHRELLKGIINHGFGNISVYVETVSGQRRKVVIECGKKWVFFFEESQEFY